MRLEETGAPRTEPGGVGLYGEAEFEAELGEAVDSGLSIVAEAEVFAFVDLNRVDGIAEDFSWRSREQSILRRRDRREG